MVLKGALDALTGTEALQALGLKMVCFLRMLLIFLVPTASLQALVLTLLLAVLTLTTPWNVLVQMTVLNTILLTLVSDMSVLPPA